MHKETNIEFFEVLCAVAEMQKPGANVVGSQRGPESGNEATSNMIEMSFEDDGDSRIEM